MYKAKLIIFAAACMLGFAGLSPVTAIAAETNTESATLSERDKNSSEEKSVIREKMQKANEKWATLTAKQKDEIYSLIEKRMQSDYKVMDKLVEFGVMDKTDATAFKSKMNEKLTKMKESGEFPLLRHRGNERRK
jgi:ribosomal protein S20